MPALIINIIECKAGLGFQDQYDNTVKKGYMSSPTGNHDGNRLANVKRGDAEQLKVAMTFFLTLSGIPFIYYGDEIGMKFIEGMPDIEGSRTRSGSRTPMQWDSNINAGFSIAPTYFNYQPYLRLSINLNKSLFKKSLCSKT